MTREEILAIECLSEEEITNLVEYIQWAETSTKALKDLLDAVFLGSPQKKIEELNEKLYQLLIEQARHTRQIVPLTFGRIETQLAPTLTNPIADLAPDEKVVDEWFRVASTCRMTQCIFKATHQLLKRKLPPNSNFFDKTNLELEKATELFGRDYVQIRSLYTALVRHDLLGAGSTDPFNEAELEANMLFDSDLTHVMPFSPPTFKPTKQ